MNQETLKGDWLKLKGKIKEKWGELTDDDLTEIEGKYDQLAGRITKRYGLAKEEAERQVRAFNEAVSHDRSCCS